MSAACFHFGSHFFATFRRGISFERPKKAERDAGNLVDGCQKSRFVCLRWFIESANLSHKLQGSGLNFLGCNGRVEVEEHFNVSAHGTRTSREFIRASSVKSVFPELFSFVPASQLKLVILERFDVEPRLVV